MGFTRRNIGNVSSGINKESVENIGSQDYHRNGPPEWLEMLVDKLK